VLDTNLKGAFLFTKAFAGLSSAALFSRTIHNVGRSFGGISAARPMQLPSSMRLIGFTKLRRARTGSRGITVNALAPCFIETDMRRPAAKMRTELLGQNPVEQLRYNRKGHAHGGVVSGWPRGPVCHRPGAGRDGGIGEVIRGGRPAGRGVERSSHELPIRFSTRGNRRRGRGGVFLHSGLDAGGKVA